MEEVFNYLKQVLKNEDTIVVATSGGPDSMFLLNILCELREKILLKIIAVHVNHHLRDESNLEAEFVKSYCQKNNVIFEYREILEYKDNIEASAREKRYEYFFEVATIYHANYIMTAHHGDDLMETILMRLTRGSSLNGYAGFKRKTMINNVTLLRPLITLTKQEIKDYMDNNNLTYVIDKSNNDLKLTRNRYRRYILPFLKKENSNVHLKYLKFSEEIEGLTNFLNNYLKEVISNIKTKDGYNIEELLKLDNYILKKVIEIELKIIYKDDLYLINDKHVNNILVMLKCSKSNMSINLPNNVIAIKEYNYFKLINERKVTNNFDYILTNELKLPIGIIKVVDRSNLTNNYVIRLNSKDIKLPIHVRSRINGDKMEVKNLNGFKKVKDILINSKVKLNKRDIIPIVVDDENKILWLPGIKKSKFDVKKDGIYDIIITYEEENDEN